MIPRIATGTLAGVCLQPLYSRYVFVGYPFTRYAWFGLLPPLLLAVCAALLCDLASRAGRSGDEGTRRPRPFTQNSFGLSLGVSFFMHAWAVKVGSEAHPATAAALVTATTAVSFALSATWLRWRQLEQLVASPAGQPRDASPRRKKTPVVGKRALPRPHRAARRALPSPRRNGPAGSGRDAAKDNRQPRARNTRQIRRDAPQRLARKDGEGDRFFGLRADSPIFRSTERRGNPSSIQRRPKGPHQRRV